MTGATAVVGRVRRAHGIKGELLVTPMTDAPDAFFAPGARLFVGTADGDPAIDKATRAPREVIVTAARDFKDGLLVMLDAVTDRTEAERWNDRTLLVPMDELDEPEDGELWLHELPGFVATDMAGQVLGEVKGWYELPQGIALEILTARGLRDVPFNDVFVRDLDRAARTMRLDLPEGLLD